MDDTIRQHKYLLSEDQMPTTWYNIMADLPVPPPPPLHPGRMDPVGPDDLAPLFPMDLIMQEVSTERYIDIPGGVLDVYRQWRPSPLFRAHRLEAALGTPARIYYKYEGVSPAGSHKTNTSVPQAYYNKKEGTTKLTTDISLGRYRYTATAAAATPPATRDSYRQSYRVDGIYTPSQKLTTNLALEVSLSRAINLARRVIKHLSEPEMLSSMADEQIFQTFLNRSDDAAEFRAARAEQREPRYTGA